MLQCQRHLFRAFCVIANYRDDRSQQVIFCENEDMCHRSFVIPSLSILNM